MSLGAEGRAIWICGPTGVGKSAVALELAERIGGEIVSVDSMQVYRGMDLGTAKPTAAERERVFHALIDVVALPEPFSAARFVDLARLAEEEIRGRGKTPIFCGGTGLYFKAYEEGIGMGPPPDLELRERLEGWTTEALNEEIERRDPVLWSVIDRRNRRRLVRAVEVMLITGQPMTALRSRWGGGDANAVLRIGLSRLREDLRERIAARVEAMFAAGLVEETRRLAGAGLTECPTARRALGYRQVLEFLEGKSTLEQAREETVLKTRQFAKRQMTWFRGQMELNWIEWAEGRAAGELAAVIEETWRKGISAESGVRS